MQIGTVTVDKNGQNRTRSMATIPSPVRRDAWCVPTLNLRLMSPT